jgi:hypothetical protein
VTSDPSATTADDHPVRLVFRRRWPRWAFTACVSVFLLIALSALTADLENPDKPAGLGQQIAVTPLALLALWITVGVARQGIWTDNHGVKIRNVFRKYRLRWDEIERIEPPRPYGAPRNAGIGFRLHDGRRINAALYSAGPINRPTFADDVVDALRRQHATMARRTS